MFDNEFDRYPWPCILKCEIGVGSRCVSLSTLYGKDVVWVGIRVCGLG